MYSRAGNLRFQLMGNNRNASEWDNLTLWVLGSELVRHLNSLPVTIRRKGRAGSVRVGSTARCDYVYAG